MNESAIVSNLGISSKEYPSIATRVQVKLFELMCGEAIADEKMMAWLEKYANDDFNAFQEFCLTHGDDEDLMTRLRSGQ